jgi:hypothetical protein
VRSVPCNALAIHVCADIASAGPGKRWAPMVVIEDTMRRAVKVCRAAGVDEQRTLAGEHATRAALLSALEYARGALPNDGLLVLSFAGHTQRGDGPLESARWCLFDGGLALSRIACQLALFPADARLVIITDTCYAAAIAGTLVGTQRALVLASCGEDQTAIDRNSREFMVRLESFVCSAGRQGTVEDLRRHLELDTPDCERPYVWTNTESWWSAMPIAVQERENGSSAPPMAS